MEHLVIINSRGKLYRRALNSLNTQFMSKLAASLIAPLRRKINYHDIAKKAIVVEPMPQGALPVYDKDVTSCLIHKTKGFEHDKIIIGPRGKVGKPAGFRVFGQRLTIPAFEIVSTPTIHISEVKRRRFNLIDRVMIKGGFKHNKIKISSRGKVEKRYSNYLHVKNTPITQQAMQIAKQQILQQEDENIFKILDSIANKDK